MYLYISLQPAACLNPELIPHSKGWLSASPSCLVDIAMTTDQAMNHLTATPTFSGPLKRIFHGGQKLSVRFC